MLHDYTYLSMYHANYFLHKIVKEKASFHSDIQFLFEKFSDILDLHISFKEIS